MALILLVELLVPLTWPIEKDDLRMTVNHHRHVPYLQLAQTSYKKDVLEYEPANVLRNAVRVGLPSLALPVGERGTRDEGIIKLLLYFFRNIAMISPPPNLPAKDEVSRSATIEAFHNQDVLALLLTISSNMGEDFKTQDTVVMEVLFHLLKGIDVQKLFMDKAQLDKKNTDELQSLLTTEKNMHRSYAKIAPTRHNRFGTMIWVKRDDERVSTVSGQDALSNNQRTLLKMDQSKRWNKPKARSRDTEPANDRFDLPVPLSDLASTHLRAFVEEFLDSSFNPLFNHIRKAIEREAERVLESHSLQFFYLISWFLEAERLRRRKRREDEKKKKKKIMEAFEADSFALVASVLNQETFIALSRFMQDRLDTKLWREVNAGTRCFTQILLIVQEMAESPLEEDQEIAENIQNRIFYEETTHDRVIAILRRYKDQGFGYLDSCTELSQVFLKMLERYSKENIHLQIRSRRRARVKRKAAASQAGKSAESGDDASEMEELADAERASKERQFDFSRLSAKFVTQGCVDTFVAFTRYYHDLNKDQLKRAHRFFYRVAFKEELSVMLFRVDIIALFNQMIKGPEGLDSKGPMFNEWDELVRQLFRRLSKKLQQRPQLIVEMLFGKIHASVFFLENGFEKVATTSKPRAPATLEVKGAMTKNEQIGVAVAVLHDDHLDAVDWVAKVLSSAANERQSWEAEAASRRLQSDAGEGQSEVAENSSRPPSIGKNAMRYMSGSSDRSLVVAPDQEERRIAMFKNNKLRLLMTLAGFERVGIDDEPDTAWIIPSALSAKELLETHTSILKHRNNPVMEYGEEDPIKAEDMLRRASAAKSRRVAYDDDSESDGIVSDDAEEFLFPAGGPTSRKSSALEELKHKRRRRKTAGSEEEREGITDKTLEARREAREAADLERRRKIKSNQFVRESDEETDEELDRKFFAREEMTRRGQSGKVLEALKAGSVSTVVEGRKRKIEGADNGGGKRSKIDHIVSHAEDRNSQDENNEEGDDDDDDNSSTTSTRSDAHSNPAPSDLEESTPLSSPHFEDHPSSQPQQQHQQHQQHHHHQKSPKKPEPRQRPKEKKPPQQEFKPRKNQQLPPPPDSILDDAIMDLDSDLNEEERGVGEDQDDDDEEGGEEIVGEMEMEEDDDIDKMRLDPPAAQGRQRERQRQRAVRARVILLSDDSDEG